MPDAAAGRRRPQAQPDRLHGLEGPRQRPGPVAYLPAAGQGSAPGRLSHAVEERGEAGFRHRWGGFAQNFAGRRIPFENAGVFGVLESREWARACTSRPSRRAPSGPYLPGTAIKGALRTGMVFANWRDGMLQDVRGRVKGERLPRRPAESVEEQALGPAGTNRMRFVSAGDSGDRRERRFQGLPAAHIHLAAARRQLCTGLEAEPAWSGGRRASGR